ncbi:heparinase II/III family protein [Thalassotalea marina]|uniref:Heparinase II/III-like C-terminal domain-containing protein n=1 Tax=Thalassotalea marina TaxID=1673741 RepID=A0A919BFG9_9GAMM|nr:heparinase II/III-family protein [Thalassotalea marina]GHF87854.1 hypothetical protein GCM10017161_14380 [Thalassotalea marina]
MPIQSPPSHEVQYFNAPEHQQISDVQVPELKAFGWLPVNTDTPPNWLASITNKQVIKNNQHHWSTLSDFDLDIGDVKTVWEHSRFNWLFPFVLKFLKDGDKCQLDKLNQWLNNWAKVNPTHQGVNWKCGQEASIRVIHLVATHRLLWRDSPASEALAILIYQHLLRIAPTMSYAIAQDNNHGTSEAAALFVGTLLLQQSANKNKYPALANWLTLARDTIENRCTKLIASDGCFSQNSTNYHRLMLDTLSFCEYIRQVYQNPAFSDHCYKKLQLATTWLAKVANQADGQSAMLGLNDGAQLLPVTCCDYLDVRPSVQWACQLFLGKLLYPADATVDQLSTLFPAQNHARAVKATLPLTMNSDYHSIEAPPWRVYLRTPTNKFRPSQCDALHLDVWHNNNNLLLSSGSYSYNDKKWQHYFPSTLAHNTVCFDDDEQMSKLSRFLYRDWLKVQVHQHTDQRLSASYLDSKKRQHLRKIEVKDQSLLIQDTVKGFKNNAVLRFHLPKDDWQLTDNKLVSAQYMINVNADIALKKIALVEGWQSRYYQNKTPIWVLEVTVIKQGTISTELTARL